MSLRDDLVRRIEANGPMSLAEYMGLCLMHPQYGYYTTRDPFGQGGDFTTAPEISQMFGELVGLSLAQAWLDQGGGPFALVELGPGRGTLMSDICRVIAAVPGCAEAAELHLVEASPHLREVQALTLKACSVTWHETVESLPDMPVFTVANEFFDALPIRQATRAEEGWSERLVGLSDGALSFGLSPPKGMPLLDHRMVDTKVGDIVEISPVAGMVAEALGTRIKARGGVALIMDYGDWGAQGDTFQAVRAHKPINPLDAPGEADLTAHVDFEAIAKAAPCAHTRLTTQGIFLERLGITARAEALAKGLTGVALEAHVAAHRRLTHPDEMGTLFKVMGLYPEGAAPPPGLEP